MRKTLALVAVPFVLAGCASSSSSSDSSPSSSTTSTTQTASAAEVCQTVAEEMPSGGLPDPSEWQALDATLDDIAAPETLATPLSDLQQAAQTLAGDPSSTDLLDARAAMRDTLEALNAECKAAGSTAFQ